MKKKILSIFFVFSLFAATLTPAAAASPLSFDVFTNSSSAIPDTALYTPDFQTNANAVYMVNRNTGAVVYEKNATTHIFPASTTKIMTAVLVLEHVQNIDTETVTVEPYMLEEFKQYTPGSYSNGGLSVGETFTIHDLLYGLMIQSASDAADTLAGYVGDGSIENFIQMMNDKAAQLGMKDTHFTNPHGLHDDNHYTSAYDLYLLTNYAMGLNYFMDIAKTPTYKFSTNMRKDQYFSSTNYMQDPNNHPDLYYKYIEGIKTGTTDEAGSCLVSSAAKGGVSYILVLMGAPVYDADGKTIKPKESFTQTRLFYEWAFKNFGVKPLLKKDSLVAEVPIRMSWDNKILRLKTGTDFNQLIPENYDLKSVRYETHLPLFINAPVKEGEVIGTMDVIMADNIIGTIDLQASASMERNGFLYLITVMQTGITTLWFKLSILFLLLAVSFFIGAVYQLNKYKKKRRKKHRSNRW